MLLPNTFDQLQSAGYRLSNSLKNNKGLLVAASLVLFALLAGNVGTTWGRFETEQQKHPDTLASINNLAFFCQAGGKEDLTLPQLEELLKLRRAKLGPDHPDTLEASKPKTGSLGF